MSPSILYESKKCLFGYRYYAQTDLTLVIEGIPDYRYTVEFLRETKFKVGKTPTTYENPLGYRHTC